MTDSAKKLVPWIAFVLAVAFVHFVTSDVFHPSLDEGIYLEGAHRLAQGQTPYKDFFAFTGPLIYIVQALLESVFGRNVPMLRLSVALSFGLVTMAICGLTMRFTDWKLGLAASFAFLSFTVTSLYRMEVNHRWLSASFFTAAIWMVVEAIEDNRWYKWAISGVCMSAAIWTTPSFLLPSALVIGYLVFRKATAAGLRTLIAAALAFSLLPAIWLASRGAFGPMVDSLLWASKHYSGANSVPYGFIPGGYIWWHGDWPIMGNISADLFNLRVLFPVVMTPIILIACVILRKRIPEALLLIAVGAAGLLFSAYPRWDVNQLIYTTPLTWVLLAALLERHAPPLVSNASYATLAMLSVFFVLKLFVQVDQFSRFETRAGWLRRTEAEALAFEKLEKRIPPDSSLWVFPYMPSLAFLLGGNNPTRYSYMQPGMMSAEDEANQLHDLHANPPQYVIAQYFPDEAVLRTWPNSDRSRLRLQSIRDFISANYHSVDVVQSGMLNVEVLERNR